MVVLPLRQNVHPMKMQFDPAWLRRLIAAGFAVALSLLASTACKQQPAQATTDTAAPAPVPSPVATAAPQTNRVTRLFNDDIPTRPNPKLQTLRLFVGPHELQTELALTELQIRTGMMFRTNINEMEAMLFVFPMPHQVGFWMKNVPINLSCAYIDRDGYIVETHDMKANDEQSIQSGSERIQYVLETKQGWFERNGVKPGALIRTERGSLQETFFQGR